MPQSTQKISQQVSTQGINVWLITMDCGENCGTEFITATCINCKKLKTIFKQKLVAFYDKNSVMYQKLFSAGGKVILGTAGWHFNSFIE